MSKYPYPTKSDETGLQYSAPIRGIISLDGKPYKYDNASSPKPIERKSFRPVRRKKNLELYNSLGRMLRRLPYEDDKKPVPPVFVVGDLLVWDDTGSLVESGDHLLADGSTIVIDGNGMVSKVVPPKSTPEMDQMTKKIDLQLKSMMDILEGKSVSQKKRGTARPSSVFSSDNALLYSAYKGRETPYKSKEFVFTEGSFKTDKKGFVTEINRIPTRRYSRPHKTFKFWNKNYDKSMYVGKQMHCCQNRTLEYKNMDIFCNWTGRVYKFQRRNRIAGIWDES